MNENEIPQVWCVSLTPHTRNEPLEIYFSAQPNRSTLLAYLNAPLENGAWAEAIAINPDVIISPMYRDCVDARDLVAEFPEIPQLEGRIVGKGDQNVLGYIMVKRFPLYPVPIVDL